MRVAQNARIHSVLPEDYMVFTGPVAEAGGTTTSAPDSIKIPLCSYEEA